MRIVTVGVAACLVMTAACSQERPEAEDSPLVVEGGLLYAGAGMNDGDVTLKPGNVLRVELESIPTAGYVWTVSDQPDFLTLVDENTRPTDPDFQNQPGVTGGSHFMAFDFKAVAPGTADLVLIEGRPWEIEAGEAPDNTYTLHLTVNE